MYINFIFIIKKFISKLYEHNKKKKKKKKKKKNINVKVHHNI